MIYDSDLTSIIHVNLAVRPRRVLVRRLIDYQVIKTHRFLWEQDENDRDMPPIAIQCPKLKVHPAPGVHIFTAGCTILGGSAPGACVHVF